MELEVLMALLPEQKRRDLEKMIIREVNNSYLLPNGFAISEVSVTKEAPQPTPPHTKYNRGLGTKPKYFPAEIHNRTFHNMHEVTIAYGMSNSASIYKGLKEKKSWLSMFPFPPTFPAKLHGREIKSIEVLSKLYDLDRSRVMSVRSKIRKFGYDLEELFPDPPNSAVSTIIKKQDKEGNQFFSSN